MEIKIDDDGVLLCPACGFEYTHMDTVHVSARAEDAEPNEITVNAVTGQISTHNPYPATAGEKVGKGRRHRISISGQCEECKEIFDLVFTQHKGYTYAEAIQIDVSQ